MLYAGQRLESFLQGLIEGASLVVVILVNAQRKVREQHVLFLESHVCLQAANEALHQER